MKTLPADVERYVERAFAPAERAQALDLLRGSVLHDGRPAGPRLMRCALLSSRGNLTALRAQVEHLGIDYRDVILEGEYVHRDGDWVQVRDLSEPLGDDS